MRIIAMVMCAAMVSGAPCPATAGYKDLKQDMEAYVPPAMALQPALSAPVPPPDRQADGAEAAALHAMRARWQEVAATGSASDGPSDAVALAAKDADRSAALLRSRFAPETLEPLIDLRNPAIQAARQRFQAALEGFDQVAQLDAILRQYSAYAAGVMPGVGPMTGMGDTIQMKFPFPGVAVLKGQVADKNVAVEKEALELVRRDTRAQGRKAYWNLIYLHSAHRITSDMLHRLEQLESVATTRYGAGKTSYQDVVKIRISREKLQEQLTSLEEQRFNLEAELLALLDLPAGNAVGVPEMRMPAATQPDLAGLYPVALEKRQELRRMRAMLGKMERMVEMAETMIQPAFSQNYSLFADEAVLQVGSVGVKPTFATTVTPTRGKGLPKNAWFGTQDAYLRETRRKRDALRADLADAEARTRWMVRTAWFDLDLALRERSLYRDRLQDLAQTSLEVSTRGYETGSVSFADVISSYTGWLEVNLAGQRRISDVGIARVELERRIGDALR